MWGYGYDPSKSLDGATGAAGLGDFRRHDGDGDAGVLDLLALGIPPGGAGGCGSGSEGVW